MKIGVTRITLLASDHPKKPQLHPGTIFHFQKCYYEIICTPIINKNINTRHSLYLQGSSGRGITGGEAVQGRRRRVYACRRMADNNPPDPH
eukprot:1146005-Pelagomonas_calceolata.AAC.1